jgi:hypothetical protein
MSNLRNLINLVEAAGKNCPRATHDLDLNVKNRQIGIDKHHYGPANPDKPGNYWKVAAKQWNIDEKTAKTMRCGNCAAFNISDSMYKCIHDRMGKEAYDAERTREAADLGYCNLLHFKCAGSRSCELWITGGPIIKD